MTEQEKAQVAINAAAATVAQKLVDSGMSKEAVAEFVNTNIDQIIVWAIDLIVEGENEWAPFDDEMHAMAEYERRFCW